jgi:hypothetical protein
MIVKSLWTYMHGEDGFPSHHVSAVQCSAVQCSAVQCSAVQEVRSQDRVAGQGLGFTKFGVLEEAVIMGGAVSAGEAGDTSDGYLSIAT